MKEFDHPDKFVNRHIGPNQDERNEMAIACGAKSVDDLIDLTVPANIRLKESLALTAPVNEHDPLGPWGAWGMAEMPYLPFTTAVVAAVHSATGIWFSEFPLTPERILRGLGKIA